MNRIEYSDPAEPKPDTNITTPRLSAYVWCRSTDADWPWGDTIAGYCLEIRFTYPSSGVMFEQPFNSVDDLPQALAEMGKGIAEYLKKQESSHD